MSRNGCERGLFITVKDPVSCNLVIGDTGSGYSTTRLVCFLDTVLNEHPSQTQTGNGQQGRGKGGDE